MTYYKPSLIKKLEKLQVFQELFENLYDVHHIVVLREQSIKILSDLNVGEVTCVNPRLTTPPYASAHNFCLLLVVQVATRWYRAPELLYGARKYDEGVDLWCVWILSETFCLAFSFLRCFRVFFA